MPVPRRQNTFTARTSRNSEAIDDRVIQDANRLAEFKGERLLKVKIFPVVGPEVGRGRDMRSMHDARKANGYPAKLRQRFDHARNQSNDHIRRGRFRCRRRHEFGNECPVLIDDGRLDEGAADVDRQVCAIAVKPAGFRGSSYVDDDAAIPSHVRGAAG